MTSEAALAATPVLAGHPTPASISDRIAGIVLTRPVHWGFVVGFFVSAALSVLFLVAAVQIFSGSPLTPLTRPLPFFAYPFLAATLVGWAWIHSRAT